VEPDLPPLIDAAARPFAGDMEMRLATRQLLDEEEAANRPATAETLARWEKADRAKRPGISRKVCMIACLVIAAVLCGFHGHQLSRMMFSYRAISGYDFDWLKSDRKKISSLPPAERYLYGDPRLSTEENALRLWRTDPENPAYFARYATAMGSDRLPPDFVETARRIDPGNSWFLYQAAADAGRKCVEKKQQTPAQKKAGEPREWNILDEARLNEALALIREAAQLPDYDSYEIEMLRKRISLMSSRTLEEQILTTAHIAGETSTIVALRTMADFISAKCLQLEKSGDTRGLIDLMADSEAFTRKLADTSEGSILHELVLQVNVTTLSAQFQTSADKLGIGAEADVWRKWSESMQERKKARDRGFNHHDLPDMRHHGGILANLVVPMVGRQVEHAPPFTIEDLGPNRDAEKALFFRGFFISGCLLAGLLMGVILISRLRHPRLIRRLSGRMEQLLDGGDWSWILGLGVVLPLCCMLGVLFLTPFGDRQFGVLHSLPWVHGYPVLAMLLVCIALVIVIADWRTRKRMAAFDPRRSIAWFGWLIIAALGTAYGAGHEFLMGADFIQNWTGWLRDHVPSGDVVLFPNNTVMMVIVGGFLLLAILSLFRNGKSTLVQATVTRTLFPALSLAMLLMSLTLPMLAAWEVRSLEHDRLVKPDPEFPSMTPYEYKVAVQLRKEIRETLGLNPLR